MTVNHHRHTAYLQQSQLFYKRGILGFGDSNILRTIIRIGLPSMVMPRNERTARDEGILKLVLYMLRNVAVICPTPVNGTDNEDNEVSRSATIDAFHTQDVFALLLTICSNMEEDFNHQDVIVLEILFHLVKGVSVEKVFARESSQAAQATSELKNLLSKESAMNRDYIRNAPSRHGRFGTMIWVKRDEEKVSTVSGQDVLGDSRKTFLKMDKSKKWSKPARKTLDREFSYQDFEKPASLSASASKHLRTFAEEFLDSGFNPLMIHIRKAIEREADRVLDINYRHFFFVVAWFLEAERVRRARQASERKKSKSSRPIEPESFGLVAGVLNQETFICLNRYMQNSLDMKEWQDLNASMRCFSQILLTVQEMAVSKIDEDQEIADNIQSRIFYEETTHDRILTILRDYKEQGFGYLDACTELSHVFLRLLERYSKENVDLQIRSRRKAQRKKKNSDKSQAAPADAAGDSEAEELADAARVSRERKFDFKRFASKFSNQKSVDTFLAFTKYYRDLNQDQLKRAHRFFYRVAFKQELSVVLFRIDIVGLFYKMVKGPEGLDSWNPMYKDWEELVRQLIRRLVRKLDERPQLAVELLFSKINSTIYYLEYGYEKQTIATNTKPAAELEVRPDSALTRDSQLGIVIGALVMDDKIGLVAWVSSMLSSAIEDRKKWQAQVEARDVGDEELSQGSREPPSSSKLPPSLTRPFENDTNASTAVRPDTEATRTAMFKNGKLRLLMTLCGFKRLGVEDTLGMPWVVPSSISTDELEDTYRLVEKHREAPQTDVGGSDPREQIRRKRVAEADGSASRAHFDDSDGDDDGNEDFMFPDNLPTTREGGAAHKVPKRGTKRKSRPENDDDLEGPDEDILEARRQKREDNALERRRKIKSDLYIRDSDDDTDEEADKEFFAQEEQRRKAHSQKVLDAIRSGQTASDKPKSKPTSKLQDDDGDIELDSDSDDELEITGATSSSSRKSNDLSDEEPISTPASELGSLSVSGKPLSSTSKTQTPASVELDDEDDDIPTRPVQRRRTGFIIDSDSE